MRIPSLDASPAKMSKLGKYTTFRMNADETAAPLAEGLKGRTVEIGQAEQEVEGAQDAVTESLALLDAAEEQADDAVLACADDVYNKNGRSRTSPGFVRTFPKGTSLLIQHRRGEQVKSNRVLGEYLSSLLPDPILEVHLPKIAERTDVLEARVKAHESAELRLGAAKARLLLAKQNFLATYTSTYGALVDLFGSKAKAERFFYRFHETSSGKEEPSGGENG